jgi:hypothetical protein
MSNEIIDVHAGGLRQSPSDTQEDQDQNHG